MATQKVLGGIFILILVTLACNSGQANPVVEETINAAVQATIENNDPVETLGSPSSTQEIATVPSSQSASTTITPPQIVTASHPACQNDYLPAVLGAEWIHTHSQTSEQLGTTNSFIYTEIVEFQPDPFDGVINRFTTYVEHSHTTEFTPPAERTEYNTQYYPERHITFYFPSELVLTPSARYVKWYCMDGGLADNNALMVDIPKNILLNSTWTIDPALGFNRDPTVYTSFGIETVTVPVGTFEAVKVKEEWGRVSAYHWYVPGIGKVKSHYSPEPFGVETVMELISYEIPTSAQTPTPTPPSFDVYIKSIRPVQVVDNFDFDQDTKIDLALGKPMVIRVEVGFSGDLSNLDPDLPIKITANFQGTIIERVLPVSTLRIFPIPLTFSAVGDLGDSPVLVEVDPDNEIVETNETNNQDVKGALVWNTNGLSVAFIKVDCFGQLDEYRDTAQYGSQFLLGQWPIAPSEFGYLVFDASMTCGKNLNQDFNNLRKLGMKLFPNVKHIVGIANQSWFDKRKPGALGVTPCGDNVHFVIDGAWQAVAHEIGHSYQLSDAFTGGVSCNFPPTTGPAYGYWVEEEQPIDQLRSLMDGYLPASYPNTLVWITPGDYLRIFEKHKTRKP